MLTKISLQSYNIYRRFSNPMLNMLTCMSARVAVYPWQHHNITSTSMYPDIGVMIPHILCFSIQHVVVVVVLLVLWMCNDGSYKLNSSVAIFSSVVRTQNIPLLANNNNVRHTDKHSLEQLLRLQWISYDMTSSRKATTTLKKQKQMITRVMIMMRWYDSEKGDIVTVFVFVSIARHGW